MRIDMNKDLPITLNGIKNWWYDAPEFHQHIHETLCECINSDDTLNKHRTYVEENKWGFGERSFWWLWKLILSELPKNPSLLEIGVFRGATLSLWKLLRPDAKCFGITPLDTSGGVWESDYASDIKRIHDEFGLKQPHIFKGRSDDSKVVDAATALLYDVVYVDGSHTYEDALFDLNTYAPCVKIGGWLIIDDAANRTHQPFGYFQGIETVSAALADWEQSDLGKEFEFCFNVVHLMCFRRKQK